MKSNYPKAYTEVLEILKFIPQQDVEKIPKDIREMMEKKKDDTYHFTVQGTDDFSKLKILDETEAIFVNFFRDYWATPEQRDKIIAKQIYDKKHIEEDKIKKYNSTDMFNINIESNSGEMSEEVIEDNLPIKYKETFFVKIINFMRKLFKLK